MRSPFGLSLLVAMTLGGPGLLGCHERRFAGPPPPDSSAPANPSGEVASAAPVDDAGAPALTWVDAVRLERWPDAAALIDALPDATRARPEVRYARARAAVKTGDAPRAIALLEGLEGELPLLVADVERWRAEAQLVGGPFDAGAAYFAKSRSAHDLARAAIGYVKAGDLATARATVERAVAAASHAKGSREEVFARAARVEVVRAQAGGDAGAEPDLRWIAAHAAGSVEGRAAAEALDRLKHPLTPREKAAAEEPAPATSAVARPAPRDRASSRGEALHAQAMDLFKARDYLAAADAFRKAAAAASGHEAEDLHYAARSLARADKDADAVKAYRAMAARFPKSPFADRSEFNAARLLLIDGSFKLAADAYGRYLAGRPRAERREEAEYERALAWLSSGAPDKARDSLLALARRAPDDKAARLHELAAVAMDRAGDRAAAVALWTETAHKAPLTWAALMSRARLAAAAAPLPPVMDPPASGAPRAPRAPLDLRLPQAPALLASVGLDGDAEAYLANIEREAVAPYAGRESEALCGLYGMLSRARRRYRVGIAGVDGSWLARWPTADERWAWDCVYPRPFTPAVRALEAEHGLPKGLVYAVMRQESGFDPAIVSPASAVGLMQLLPSTARQAASEMALPLSDEDLVRPDVNLRIGAFYLAKLFKMFGGNLVLAAAAYNAGPRAVSHWMEGASDGDLDLWVARIPYEETRTYVARVAQNVLRYEWLEGGDDAVMALGLALPDGVRAPADAY